MTRETKLAIEKKARKDARKHGCGSTPTRGIDWTDEAWLLYESSYLDEINAIDNGF